jgi:hypothetical protein
LSKESWITLRDNNLRKKSFHDIAKGKTSYSVTENITLFPKKESSKPVSEHHTFMNSLLIEMIDTY